MKGKLTKAFLFGTIGSLILWIMFMVIGAICAIWQGVDILPKFFRTSFSYWTLTILACSMGGLLSMSFISTIEGIAKDFNTLLGVSDTKDISFIFEDKTRAWLLTSLFVFVTAMFTIITLHGATQLGFVVLSSPYDMFLACFLAGGLLLSIYMAVLTRLSAKHVNGLVGRQIIISRDDDARRENHKLREELRNATDEMEYLHEKLEAQMRKLEEDTDKTMEVASCHMMPNDAYLGVECATSGTAYFGRWLAIITFRDGTVYKRVVNDKYQEEFNAFETFRDAEATNCLKDAKSAKSVVTKFRRHVGSSSRKEAAQAFLAECRKRPGFKLGEEARHYLTQLAGKRKNEKGKEQ